MWTLTLRDSNLIDTGKTGHFRGPAPNRNDRLSTINFTLRPDDHCDYARARNVSALEMKMLAMCDFPVL